MSIVCSLIAEEKKSLAACVTPGGKIFPAVITSKILPKLSGGDHKRTLQKGEFDFHYKYSGKNIYFCVATIGFSKRICWDFIEDVQDEHMKMVNPNSFQLKSLLEQKMMFHNDLSNDKIFSINQKVNEVKNVMIDDIDQILQNAEKMAKVAEDADEMVQNCNVFHKQAQRTKNHMFFKWICFKSVQSSTSGLLDPI